MPSLFERPAHRRIKSGRTSNFRRNVLRGVLQLALLVSVVFVVWHGTRLSAFTLTDIVVEGGETVSHDDIKATVLTELQGSYFLIIPKRFAYLYPHDRIVDVVSKVPRIYDVQAMRTSRKTLTVSFKEYQPHALACPDRTDMPCHFMSADGLAFAEAPLLKGGSFVRHTIEGVEEIAAGQILERELISRIDTFIRRANEEIGFRITSLFHKKNGDIELYVNGGGTILIAANDDLSVAFENLRSVLGSEEFKHLRPGNFNYIDIRFGNKVFVNEEMSTSTRNSAVE